MILTEEQKLLLVLAQRKVLSIQIKLYNLQKQFEDSVSKGRTEYETSLKELNESIEKVYQQLEITPAEYNLNLEELSLTPKC